MLLFFADFFPVKHDSVLQTVCLKTFNILITNNVVSLNNCPLAEKEDHYNKAFGACLNCLPTDPNSTVKIFKASMVSE